MGNRAVIAIGNEQQAKFGIYLHWNGGRDSVEAFLAATKQLMKDRGPDDLYGPARLVQVITNFIGGNLSVGLGALDSLDCDNKDNGVYYVDPKKLEIIGRKHVPNVEQNNRKHYKDVFDECITKNSEPFYRDRPRKAQA